METDRRAGYDIAAPGTFDFRTDDLGHAVEFVARNFGDHTRVTRRRGRLGYRISAATSGRVRSGQTSCALPTVVRAATPVVVVHLPLRHGAEYRVGRRVLQSSRDTAVMLCPGHDYTVVAPPGETLAFLLQPSLLYQEIEALQVKRRRTWALRSAQLSLTPASISILRALVTRHGVAVTRAKTSRRADELYAIEGELVDWLARQVIATDGLLPLSVSNRQIVQRVDSWIRRHLSQPITLEQLRAEAGVSARTLQEACLARWSRTPLELVAARRLEAVRSMLVAGAVPTVTEAALRSGFSHLGRFSSTYHRAFGELPSDTHARALKASIARRPDEGVTA
jgi:AraC-like DNA-binding protein